jgi:hypothetical protein
VRLDEFGTPLFNAEGEARLPGPAAPSTGRKPGGVEGAERLVLKLALKRRVLSNDPPAKPEALRLQAPQRGLTTTDQK